MLPFSGQLAGGVRRIYQRVVLGWPVPVLNLLSLSPDCKHCVDKAIKLFQWLRFGWLNHEGSVYREAHCWGVESVVDQSLSNVVIVDSSRSLQRANIDDCFVSNQSVFPGVQKRVGIGESLGHVVCA